MNISLEKLQHIAAYAAQQKTCGLTAHIPPHDMIVITELAMLALRQAQQEPVGAFHIVDGEVEATTDYCKRGEFPIQNGLLEVYAAPTAPAVPPAYEPTGNVHDYYAGWNACRAAMLQQSNGAGQLSGNSEQLGNTEPVSQPDALTESERATYEAFISGRLGETLDTRRAKNGDQKNPDYMDFAMGVGWIAWQQRAAIAANSPTIPDDCVPVPLEIIDRFPEINVVNYNHGDVCALNSWGCELVLAAAPRGKGGEA
ncbi:hypothetical protein DZA65_03205 [Dickeya dianthicola]|uniref:hypothetical protein n=1 Tax=Dickeya dianthicola TaxID=204039 RepID=UPI000CD48C10|nr:hypothetical protein [Dickeya dianthicola]AYC20080.1 hypothetical protein DZA65_03205 [Dickeya dianthicola]MBI0437130.1 hypothetical protein [Dickeya dianthicola]MBI0448664.1 hypothetical protein [Dickeya dianthicola]MBI0452091.1 hypothetical protein [Dickeya dianthicola]MBI0456331.1 hypothetical protein [Dickeya dianthicola]